MSYLQEAFNLVCSEAKEPETWYVTLMQEERYYGGPEEGGWWGTNTHIVAYQAFLSEELARIAAEEVRKLAKELEEEARKEHGDQCLRELEWLDARGLDADWLPEPDGPDTYEVIVSQSLPQEARGPTHYE